MNINNIDNIVRYIVIVFTALLENHIIIFVVKYVNFMINNYQVST